MCMMSAVECRPSLWMILWCLCGNELWRIVTSQLRNSAVISHCLLHKIVMEHLLFRKLCTRWVPKQLNLNKSKAHEVSIDISAVIPLWRWRVSEPDHHRWWNVGCTHYSRNQVAVNALVSQWISLQDEIQADFVGTVFWDRWDILLIDFWPVVRWMLSITVKHCRNCNGPFRTCGTGCLVPVLSCCTITVSHTWLDGQYICRSSAVRCLLMLDLVPRDYHFFLHLK